MAELFDVRMDGEITVIGCRGAIVFGGEAADLGSSARELMGPGRRMVMDLSGVVRLDSFGIGVLFGIYTAALTMGTTLVLSGIRPAVRQALEQASLISVLTVYGSDAEAVQALALKKPLAERYH